MLNLEQLNFRRGSRLIFGWKGKKLKAREWNEETSTFHFWTPAQLTLYTNIFRICFCFIEIVLVYLFVT
ncbi:hypothetical protein RchiOBHm_Chr7g0217901 [Rosa chinensis]|uniref:Uncharacterized protein n=1 Tax=Rosa chinensis TaxID=74649 RepID=A0A2P6PC49_ROSCH|nr:hypothetical protein RchiOBHm_Chr7g0217901 [Rosa chinensis]